jgi:fructose-bisphosphate aldolase class II
MPYTGENPMPLVTSTEILKDAYRNHYAVGSFNAHNMETAVAIIKAAESENAPVIVQFSRISLEYAGLETAANLVKTAAHDSTVPVVLHLDHGMDLGLNLRCLRAGFTSLMFDGTEILLRRFIDETGTEKPSLDVIAEKVSSREAFEENLNQTCRIVEIAHSCGVPVEAELGRIPRLNEMPAGQADRPSVESREYIRRLYTRPEMAEEFVARSRCDSLAVACGSVHGMGDAVQPLDIGHLQALSAVTHIPLVLHGSSGVVRSREEAASRGLALSEDEGGIKEAIQAGIAKVNVSTELQIVFLQTLRTTLSENPHINDIRKLFPRAVDALKKRLVSFIRLFGSSGRA